MFGGLSFLANGKMLCGVARKDLVVRVGPTPTRTRSRDRTRPMDFTGKPLRGMVYVAPAGVRTDAQLREWVERGLAFVRSQK